MDQASSLRKIFREKASEKRQRVFAKRGNGDVSETAPRVMAVTSGKGGVGKTNIVGNLAIAFAKLGKKVLILDADLGLANIDIIFGIHPEYNIGHVLSGEKQLSEVIVDGPEGIRIIPAGSGFVNLTHLTEGQKLSLLGEFDALNDLLDVFLIDTGAGISSNVMYFNLAADECILVATAESTSITDAYAMMKVMSTEHGATHFKLLVNMVQDEAEAKSVYQNLSVAVDRFLSGVVLEYVGFLPSDEMIKRAVRSCKPVMQLYPNAVSSNKIKKIASELMEAPRRPDSDGNIKFFLNRFLDYREEFTE